MKKIKHMKITKDKLQSGDLIVIASGEIYVVLKDKDMMISITGWMDLSGYDNKLKYLNKLILERAKDYFITDIYRHDSGWSWNTTINTIHFIPSYIKE